jgi:hypothetical protein
VQTIERATPSSPKYAEWFTPTQVLDLIAPGESVGNAAFLIRRMRAHTEAEVVETVVNWARKQGLAADGSRRDQVIVEGSVAAVERALQCRLAYWQHDSSDTVHLRTTEWTLPDDVHQHVHVLGGLTEFWGKPKGPRIISEVKPGDLKKRNDVRQASSHAWQSFGFPTSTPS